jgi:hypothetical protein
VEGLLRSLDRSLQMRMRAAIAEHDPAADAPLATASYAQVETQISPQTMPAPRAASRTASTRPGRLHTEGSEPMYLPDSSELGGVGSSRGGVAHPGLLNVNMEGSESSFMDASPAVLSSRGSSRIHSGYARPVAAATFVSGAR